MVVLLLFGDGTKCKLGRAFSMGVSVGVLMSNFGISKKKKKKVLWYAKFDIFFLRKSKCAIFSTKFSICQIMAYF